MKKVIIIAAALSIIISITMTALIGCTEKDLNRTTELEPVEITEYEGSNLSSVDDFRENSIKGPQRVDIEGYQLKISGLVENERSYLYDEVISQNQTQH